VNERNKRANYFVGSGEVGKGANALQPSAIHNGNELQVVETLKKLHPENPSMLINGVIKETPRNSEKEDERDEEKMEIERETIQLIQKEYNKAMGKYNEMAAREYTSVMRKLIRESENKRELLGKDVLPITPEEFEKAMIEPFIRSKRKASPGCSGWNTDLLTIASSFPCSNLKDGIISIAKIYKQKQNEALESKMQKNTKYIAKRKAERNKAGKSDRNAALNEEYEFLKRKENNEADEKRRKETTPFY
jgi:hypothetical protein